MDDTLTRHFEELTALLIGGKTEELMNHYKDVENEFRTNEDFLEFLIKFLNEAANQNNYEIVGNLLKKISGFSSNKNYEAFLDFFDQQKLDCLQLDSLLTLQNYLKNVKKNNLSADRYAKIEKIRDEMSKKIKKSKKIQGEKEDSNKSQKTKVKKESAPQVLHTFTFNEAIDFIRNKHDELIDKVKQHQQCMNKLSNLEKNKEELLQQIGQNKEKIEGCEKTIKEQSAEIKQLENRLKEEENKNKKLQAENDEYKQANIDLQREQNVMKEQYIAGLSDALKIRYDDYKKIMTETDVELWKTVMEKIFELLSRYGIKIEE